MVEARYERADRDLARLMALEATHGDVLLPALSAKAHVVERTCCIPTSLLGPHVVCVDRCPSRLQAAAPDTGMVARPGPGKLLDAIIARLARNDLDLGRVGVSPSWAQAAHNLDSAAIYIWACRDKPRAWGKKQTPPGSLHAKDIEIGLGLTPRDGARLYADMKGDPRFLNPTPNQNACYELTSMGEEWAARDGRTVDQVREQQTALNEGASNARRRSWHSDGGSLDQLRHALAIRVSEQDWERFNQLQNPKHLTAAVAREASQLAAVLEWVDPRENIAPYQAQLEDEIADLFGDLVRLCDVLEINPIALARAAIARSPEEAETGPDSVVTNGAIAQSRKETESGVGPVAPNGAFARSPEQVETGLDSAAGEERALDRLLCARLPTGDDAAMLGVDGPRDLGLPLMPGPEGAAKVREALAWLREARDGKATHNHDVCRAVGVRIDAQGAGRLYAVMKADPRFIFQPEGMRAYFAAEPLREMR